MNVYRLSIIKKPEGVHRIIQKDCTVEHWFDDYRFRKDQESNLHDAYLWFAALCTSIQNG